MGHLHSVHDSDAHLKINAITRVITNASSGKTVLVQGDHNSERFTFEVPRVVDGHDLSQCNVVQIHYINIDSANKANTSAGVYEADDLQISPDGDDVVILSWLISGNATKYAGSLNFLVKFKCVDDDCNVGYVWNTAIYTGISVSSGIDNVETVVEEYADVLVAWEHSISNMEQIVSEMERKVDNLVELELDTTLSQSGKVADAKAVGDAINQAVQAAEQAIENAKVTIDPSLSEEGQAADAGAVGAVIQEAAANMGALQEGLQQLSSFPVLPKITEADNGKVPQVENDTLVYKDAASLDVGGKTLEIYIADSIDSYIEEALEGEY